MVPREVPVRCGAVLSALGESACLAAVSAATGHGTRLRELHDQGGYHAYLAQADCGGYRVRLVTAINTLRHRRWSWPWASKRISRGPCGEQRAARATGDDRHQVGQRGDSVKRTRVTLAVDHHHRNVKAATPLADVLV